MRGALLVALAATIGNLLQGWDNSTIAGSVLYIKKEFSLESQPTLEGLILAMSPIGGTVITTFSGAVSDSIGRRPMLILSSVFYFTSGLIMLWSPNVYLLLLARLLDGFGIALAVTVVPVYISETAPPEIRGQLGTFPQLAGSSGMFLSYCMVFGMSLMDAPNWRLMLGVICFPSIFYFALTVFFLPESPRWLVSKGRMVEAKRVLQALRGKEDVTGELALLVEGLGIGRETSIEEYMICPSELPDNLLETTDKKNGITLYGAEEGVSWVAKPATGKSLLDIVSRHGSMSNQKSMFLMDPLVTLFGSVHGSTLDSGGNTLSALLPNLGSLFNMEGHHARNELYDEENLSDGGDYVSDVEAGAGADSDDNLQSPLLSRQTTVHHPSGSGGIIGQCSGLLRGEPGSAIGGGWLLAWKRAEKTGEDGRKEEAFQRVFLHHESTPESQHGSVISTARNHDVTRETHTDGLTQATALVSQAMIRPKDLISRHPLEKGIICPAETSAESSSWRHLLDPGVKRALYVGVGLQVLQQVSGINGILYYTPQILKQAGVDVLLSKWGIGSDSASLLISAMTTFMMLPCIVLAMKLMDISGRRLLMLATIPLLIVSLIALVLADIIDLGSVGHAAVSALGVVVYASCFVMGFGAIPNIICSEIFPTRVRGICIAICALTYWVGNISITYSLPIMLNSIGIAGIFSIYAIGCIISWIFIFLKVPETKGMPLEVISEFFAVSAKQVHHDAGNS